MKTRTDFAPLAPFFASLVTARFYETWDFYTTLLGFRTVQESNDRVRLVHATSGVQLAIVRAETDGEPRELVPATDGRGWSLNLEVHDVDERWMELTERGVATAVELAREPWGERRFAVRDPNGVLVFFTQRADARTNERACEETEAPAELSAV